MLWKTKYILAASIGLKRVSSSQVLLIKWFRCVLTQCQRGKTFAMILEK